jgi:hypothetical protein
MPIASLPELFETWPCLLPQKRYLVQKTGITLLKEESGIINSETEHRKVLTVLHEKWQHPLVAE